MNLRDIAVGIRDESLAWVRHGFFFRLKEGKISSHSLITAVFPSGADHRILPTTVSGFSDPHNLNSNGVQECQPSVKISATGFLPKKSDKLCLMAHFDPHGRIEPYVIYYIEALSEEGFDVVLISTSEVLDDSDVKNALRYSRGIIVRKNIGLDFASWKTAFDFIPDVWTYRRILLANDSVFGPFFSLKEVFKKFEESPAQVCGLTDCLQIGYHLQSYFLYLKSEVFSNCAFIGFWRNMRIKHVKMEIVREYEVGFSRELLSAGVELYALCKYDEIIKYVKESLPEFQYMTDLKKHPLNPSLHMWDILLVKYGFPFIKTEILKANRFNSHSASEWKRLIPESSRELIPIIENYLKNFHH